MRKVFSCLGLSMVLMLLFGGCGASVDRPIDEVRAAIGKTESQPRRFIYKESDGTRDVTVVGAIQDDYGYKARLSLDGTPILDEVAVDDELAVRFVTPEAISNFSAGAGAQGGDVLSSLQARRWVIDRAGAPDLTRPGFQSRLLGQDPVLDALTVFTLVGKVMNEGEGVRKFNRQALDYVARDDRFPQPAEDSPIERFDLVPAQITPITGSPNDIIPDTPNFRRMSVYVRDGVTIRILDLVDLGFRYEELAEALDLETDTADPQVVLRRAFASLNELRTARGLAPIRLRTMSYEVVDLGKPVSIVLPLDAVEGSLSVIRNRGKGAGAGPAPGAPNMPPGAGASPQPSPAS